MVTRACMRAGMDRWMDGWMVGRLASKSALLAYGQNRFRGSLPRKATPNMLATIWSKLDSQPKTAFATRGISVTGKVAPIWSQIDSMTAVYATLVSNSTRMVYAPTWSTVQALSMTAMYASLLSNARKVQASIWPKFDSHSMTAVLPGRNLLARGKYMCGRSSGD